MRQEIAGVKQLVKDIDSSSTEWIPDPVLDHIIGCILEGQDPEKVIADSQSQDTENANWISSEMLGEIVAITLAIKETVYAAKATWDFIAFVDKAAEYALNPNKKLEIANKVVVRLKQAGLTVSAERVQGWIDYVLERMTRPKK